MPEPTVAEVLREAARRLAVTSDSARLDAELLMAHVLGVSRSDLLLRRMNEAAPPEFERLVERRERHEPVAYILGRQEFYGREFAVRPGVLIPRADSETTIAAALEASPDPRRVLDCGVGSGALLVTLLAERPDAGGVGVDRSDIAVAVASENAALHARHGQWRMELRDWSAQGWSDQLGRFDLILANPPYVEAEAQIDPDVRDWEPAEALFAGSEGLADYQILVPQLATLLTADGVAVLEIGAGQAEAVAAIAAQAGFASELRRDLAGRPRALILRLTLGKRSASYYLPT